MRRFGWRPLDKNCRGRDLEQFRFLRIVTGTIDTDAAPDYLRALLPRSRYGSAMHSISTSTFLGSVLTATQLRAGL